MEQTTNRATQTERRQLVGMAVVLIALHSVGWGILLLVVVPSQDGTGTAPIGVGIGLTAYTLGMRHAFDADHIAAIDNVTRRLAVTKNGRSPSVGFFFSLGHSTVVFALALVLAFGLKSVVKPMLTGDSLMHHVTSILGSGISGVFLLVVGVLNIISLVKIAGPKEAAAAGGVFSRVLVRPLRSVARARHMYPIGFLFGLGFDTATEIGLLVVAAGSLAAGLPWYGVLCLPILFAAGMVLFDSLDGVFVSFAYSWALADSSRKLRYNIAVTLVSVAVAITIGAVEIASSLSEGFAWRGPLQIVLDSIDFNLVGVIVVISLTLIFLAVLVIKRTSRIDRAQPPARIESADPSLNDIR